MTKDTATIRDVYTAISDMRREMQDMKKELKTEFQTTMNAHCEWAKETVSHYEDVAKNYDKRINETEKFIDNLTGKMAVIGGVIAIITTLFVDYLKQIFAKGN